MCDHPERVSASRGRPPMPDPAAIIASVAARHGLDAADLTGPSTDRTLVGPRQDVMYELREAGLPYSRIGALLGRHHTSVIHGVRVYASRHGLPIPGRQSGPKPQGVDASRVRRHLLRLREQGMTRVDIAGAAGMNATHVSRIVCGRQRHVLPTTAARLLAVEVPASTCEDCDRPALGGGRWCAVGRCDTGRRWSWSQKAAA